ncbi:MAG TPA: ATP-binding protein [Spirochaetia bacterium]|nr:ATP-binding protein [Spirochaetia bacterium]
MITETDGNPSLMVLDEALASARNMVLYRGVLEDHVCGAWLRFVQACADRLEPQVTGELFSKLFFLLSQAAERPGDAWQNHLLDLILYDDNAFTRAAAAGPDRVTASVREAALGDLCRLQNMFRLDASQAAVWSQTENLGVPGGRPSWRDLAPGRPDAADRDPTDAIRILLQQAPDWRRCLDKLDAYHRRAGAGLFGRFRAVRWLGRAGRLEGIAEPDPVTMEDLFGYQSQRAEVLANTERFLAGWPANNLLLYGDRGTGKSSTVKALLNRYQEGALRLVEVAKSDLKDFPRIMRELRNRPQRFILFVDDLSFEEGETEYKELKAVLEGGLESRSSNVVIYATSNRRHLVREHFADRQPEYGEDGEVRIGDTVQEKLSLADRFGITVLFIAPDKPLFLEIVRGLAGRRGITVPVDELERRALLWEVWQNGRSGRSARQFIDYLCAEEASPAGQGGSND